MEANRRKLTIGDPNGSYRLILEVCSDDPQEIENYRQVMLEAAQKFKSVREPRPCHGCGEQSA